MSERMPGVLGTARLMVRVKQRDVDGACSLQSRNCPIAYALRRETGGLWAVTNGWAVRVEHGTTYSHAAPLPMRARLFVRNYDKGNGYARPFTFFLTVPKRTVWAAHRHQEKVAKERQALDRDLRKAALEAQPRIEAEVAKERPWMSEESRLGFVVRRVEAEVYKMHAARIREVARLEEGWKR